MCLRSYAIVYLSFCIVVIACYIHVQPSNKVAKKVLYCLNDTDIYRLNISWHNSQILASFYQGGTTFEIKIDGQMLVMRMHNKNNEKNIYVNHTFVPIGNHSIEIVFNDSTFDYSYHRNGLLWNSINGVSSFISPSEACKGFVICAVHPNISYLISKGQPTYGNLCTYKKRSGYVPSTNCGAILHPQEPIRDHSNDTSAQNCAYYQIILILSIIIILIIIIIELVCYIVYKYWKNISQLIQSVSRNILLTIFGIYPNLRPDIISNRAIKEAVIVSPDNIVTESQDNEHYGESENEMPHDSDVAICVTQSRNNKVNIAPKSTNNTEEDDSSTELLLKEEGGG